MDTFQHIVLEWYARHGRKLPWRETKDPYKILVSEMMLQQTQVDRVIPKYHMFLARFPTVQALASAPTSDVLKLWSGLGYNRRALYLQTCAQEIVALRHFPDDVDGLRILPGIGPYTGAAVLSFAFNADIPVIDVNIELLYKRIFYGNKETVEALAVKHLPLGRSRDWHNALMDLGSLFCTSKNPKCSLCPLEKVCSSADNEKRIQETRKKKNVIPFRQSDRIVRGTILKLLTAKPYSISDLHVAVKNEGIERTAEHFQRIVSQLESDGLIEVRQKMVRLPSQLKKEI